MGQKALLTIAVALLMTLRAVPGEEPAQREAKALRGTWRLIALELDGEKQALPEAPADRVNISENRISADDECFSYKLDPSANPKLIDMTRLSGGDKGQVLEGIYQLRGDALTICLFGGAGARSRPTEFASNPGSGCALFTLERQKD